MYRIRPSVKHVGRMSKIEMPYWKTAPHVLEDVISLGQYRWDPTPGRACLSGQYLHGRRLFLFR